MDHRSLERADGRKLAVRSFGSGPPIVALAGGPGADARYLENLAGLDSSHRLIIPDARGTGGSDAAADPQGHGFAALARDIETVRVAFEIDGLDLLAHSAACTTALLYATDQPQRIRSLTLICPSAHLLHQVESDQAMILERRRDEPWYEDVVAATSALALPGAGGVPVQDLIRRLAPAQYARWTARERAHAELFAVNDVRLIRSFWTSQVDADAVRHRLGGLGAPALIITGGLDAATGVAAGTAWAEVLPGGRHVHLPDAAHVPWVDAPEAFVQTVRSFLAVGR